MIVATIEPTAEFIDFLNADSPLLTLAPHGVWEDPAPQDPIGAERVTVVVNLQTAPSDHTGGGASHLECWYAVQARGPASKIADIRNAARRIDALLHCKTFALPGYHLMGAFRDSVLARPPEPESVTGLRWMWRGALYRLYVVAV